MKHTIKMGATRALIIEPAAKVDEVLISATVFGTVAFTQSLSMEHAAAVLFAFEETCECIEGRRLRSEALAATATLPALVGPDGC